VDKWIKVLVMTTQRVENEHEREGEQNEMKT